MPNLALPVASEWDNLPGRLGFPTTLKSGLCPLVPARSAMLCAPLHQLCGFHDCGGMPRVGAAAADIAGKRLFAVVLGRFGILVQESLGRDHEPGGAVTTLHRVPLAVGLDQGAPFRIGGDP